MRVVPADGERWNESARVRAGRVFLSALLAFGLTGCSGGGPVPSAGTAPSTPVEAPTTPNAGWTVDEHTVGLEPLGLDCASLPPYSGPTIVPRGAVISEVRVRANALDLSAGGITIERSCVQPRKVPRGVAALTTTNAVTGLPPAEKVVVRDSEIDGSQLSLELAAWSVGFAGVADLSNNYIHGFGTGINLMFTGTNLDAVVERNYVTGLVAWGDPRTNGNHSDAFTIRDFDATQRAGRSVVVRNNRFDCSSGNDTGAFFIQAYAGRIDNLAVEGNLLEGNGYQLGLESNRYGYGTVTAVNNRFTGTGFGATYVQGGSGWSQWQDNYRYSAVAADGKGTMVTEP